MKDYQSFYVFFFHHKYHHEQWQPCQWVLGGIELGLGNHSLVEVLDREAETLCGIFSLEAVLFQMDELLMFVNQGNQPQDILSWHCYTSTAFFFWPVAQAQSCVFNIYLLHNPPLPIVIYRPINIYTLVLLILCHSFSFTWRKWRIMMNWYIFNIYEGIIFGLRITFLGKQLLFFFF